MADNERMTAPVQSELVRTILIVDDSESCAAALELALLGIPALSICRAPSGVEALRMVHESGPALQAIITDLNLPGMDGFELIRRVRENGRTSAVPIIVVSADTDPVTPGRIAQMKVDAYFAKPFSPALLRRKLEQLLDATIA
jgi:two-component system chemotaxis response regulator CheY